MAGLNEGDTNIPLPVVVPEETINQSQVSHPRKAMPVWVQVAVDDGTERQESGFALAWTDRYVLVQVLWPKSYYKGAVEFWTEAEHVTRRVIDPQWLGRDESSPAR